MPIRIAEPQGAKRAHWHVPHDNSYPVAGQPSQQAARSASRRTTADDLSHHQQARAAPPPLQHSVPLTQPADDISYAWWFRPMASESALLRLLAYQP